MPDYIKITTPQNVEIEYKLAGLGNRIVAKLLDLIIITGYVLFMSFFGEALGGGYISLVFLLPCMFYTLLFEKFNEGQTPGKSIRGIKVVSLDGTPVTFGMYLIKWMLQFIDVWIFSGVIGLMSIGMSKYQQRLGDMAARTTVISLRSDVRMEDTIYRKTSPNYKPVFIEASQLSESDIRTIKKVLKDRSPKRYELLSAAADKIQDYLNITKTSSSETFLKVLVKDFNHYQQSVQDPFYEEE